MANQASALCEDLVLGACSDFAPNKLPTKSDVIRQHLFTRRKSPIYSAKQDFFRNTAIAVRNIWIQTKIPIIAQKSIVTKVTRLYNEYRSVFKSSRKKSFEKSAQNFRDRMNVELFDIAVCSCVSKCKCSYEFKVPVRDKAFLADQRGTRQMNLPTIPSTTASIEATTTATEATTTTEATTITTTTINASLSSTASSPAPKKRRGREVDLIVSKYSNDQSGNNVTPVLAPRNLQNVARECQRMNISTRAAATLINAFKKDSGDLNNVIDRNKIIRAINTHNHQSTSSHTNTIRSFVDEHDFFGLFFDGKKDTTNVYVHNENTRRSHMRKRVEDTLVFQPNNKYYSHITVTNGKANTIAKEIWDKLQSDQINLSKIMFIGCDGTNLNTGHSGGR